MIWFKRSLITLFAIVLWALLTLLFISKERVCNALINSAAAKAGITFCIEKKDSSMVGCEADRVTLLYGHSSVAKARSVDISPYEVSVTGVKLEGAAKEFLPPKIESILYKPISGEIYSQGDFGVLKGVVSWGDRKVSLELLPSSLMKREFRQTLGMFKMKKGKYRYDFSF